MNKFYEPEAGTREWYLHYLDLLQKWLSLNPKNSQLVEKEATAVKWALEQLDGADDAQG